MALPAADLITQIVETAVLGGVAAHVVDLQADPRGGYFALVEVVPQPLDSSPACLLRFDDAHNLIGSWILGVSNPEEFAWNVMSVAAMTVGLEGIFIVGTVSATRGGFYSRAFVMKLSLDVVRQWARVYRPFLVDGCRVPYDFHTTGRGIVRLPAPDDGQLMVVFQTSVLADGSGLPPADDAVGAMVFGIDNDGDPTTDVTRHFVRGQFVPVRLRLLPSAGPTIVGRTRSAGTAEPWMPAQLRVDRNGNSVAEHAYDCPRSAVLRDIAEGSIETMGVGSFDSSPSPATAFTMHFGAGGSLLECAEYQPAVGDEFFGCELHALQVLDDEFIAAGWAAHDLADARPWLLRVQPGLIAPIWQKRYPVNTISSPEASTFEAILFNLPNRVIAAGCVIHAVQPPAPDRIPFLAVSEAEPGSDQPRCSQIDLTRTGDLRPGFLDGHRWMDRMHNLVEEWFPTVEAVPLPRTVLCSREGIPPAGQI